MINFKLSLCGANGPVRNLKEPRLPSGIATDVVQDNSINVRTEPWAFLESVQLNAIRIPSFKNDSLGHDLIPNSLGARQHLPAASLEVRIELVLKEDWELTRK